MTHRVWHISLRLVCIFLQAFFILFIASVKSRNSGPTLVPGVFFLLFFLLFFLFFLGGGGVWKKKKSALFWLQNKFGEKNIRRKIYFLTLWSGQLPSVVAFASICVNNDQLTQILSSSFSLSFRHATLFLPT